MSDQTIDVEGAVLVDNDLAGFDDETPEWRRAFFQALSGSAATAYIDQGGMPYPFERPERLVRKAEAIADEVDRLRLRRAKDRKEARDKARGDKLNKILNNTTGFRNKANGEILTLFTATDDGTKVYFSGGWTYVDKFDELFEPVDSKET
jgi:hypothetical protein